MTDEVTPPVVVPQPIGNSKLYAVLRTKSYFDKFTPDLPTRMQAEIEINDQFPREADDGDDTRILINYTNPRGNPSLFKAIDKERLDRVFTIDDFMNGLLVSLQANGETTSTDTAIDDTTVADTVMFALSLALITTMNLNPDPNITEHTKTVSDIILRSLVSVIFDDPLDVLIALNDRPSTDDPTEFIPTIVGMWVVKARDPVPVDTVPEDATTTP